ncbi:hypothetical protein ACIBCB_36190 [Streptomyces uncialis]|uniref:hypothetical protein n=1 Tax=Streptomyces uncialis TaxID=1048205 RepID=UPI003794D8E4
MASSSSGIVAGLTAAALVTVGFLAYQASASAPVRVSPGVTSQADAAVPVRDKRDPKALPAGTGGGARVVYALEDDRVWLADGSRVRATYTVTPSTVDPVPGTYTVTSRTGRTAGSDGVGIEHVVRFAVADGVSIGFSAAVDGARGAPDPRRRTGGIRSTRAQGDAMWDFAVIGTKVVVIP